MSVIVIGAATADMEQYVVMEGHLTLSLADTLRHYKRTVMVLYACRRICMQMYVCTYVFVFTLVFVLFCQEHCQFTMFVCVYECVSIMSYKHMSTT